MLVFDENVEKSKGNQESIGKDMLKMMSKDDRGKFHGVISNNMEGYNILRWWGHQREQSGPIGAAS